MNRRVRENGIKYFNPNGPQEKFVNAIGQGDIFIGIFSAANGVGKTALMANILGSFIFDNSENPWFDYPIYKDFPYPKRARIASSSKNVEEIGAIQTELKRWFPVGKYTTGKHGKTFNSEYIIDDWVLDIMTYEQDVSQFESATLGLMIFDEPPPMRILHASVARLRKGGMILIFMTPLDTGGEILEDLTSTEAIEYEGETIGKVYCQYAEIEENCKQHGIRGQLEHADIIKMLNFYDSEEKEARAKGKPIHMVGRIFSDYEDKDPYMVDDFEIPEDWVKINILDPHDAIPYALSWVALDPTGQLWVYDEFPFDYLEKIQGNNLAIPDYARIIREKEGRSCVKLRIIDPFFGNKTYSNTGKTVKQELADVGLDFVDGDTSGIELGHKKIREYLKYQKAFPASPSNHPKIHILKKCINHRRSFMRYKRKILKSGEVKDKITIDETYKHYIDNMRHLVMRPDLWELKNQSDGLGVSVKVVGDLKDVHIEVDEDEGKYGQYRRVTQGVGV